MKSVLLITALFIPSLAFSAVNLSVVCKSPEAAEAYLLEAETKPAWRKIWERASAYIPLRSACSRGKFKAVDVKFLYHNIFKDEATALSKKIEIFEGELIGKREGDKVFFFSPPCQLNKNCADNLSWTSQGPLDVCTDFPEVLRPSTPEEAILGKPFEYRVRFSCDWSSRYKRKKLRGGFTQRGRVQSVVAAMRTEKLPSNEEVLVIPMSFPKESVLGNYLFEGCLEIEDSVYSETLCVDLFEADIRVKN